MPNPQNAIRLGFFDENFRLLKDAINHHKDAIHRVSCLNRIVLPSPQKSLQDIAAAMPTAGYAYANKIARLTKEIKINAS
ncbi:hypothetical protein [Nostoc sp.]|uniref:hypothetical protein n=1 Tax=Nostoc sp. TaxID=1180 RepID=UPI002FF484C8